MMIRRLVLLSFAGFAAYILWPYSVFRLKHENPRTTSVIELRKAEARRLKRKFKPRMEWKNLGQISPNLIHAVLLAEDDTFYKHHGFDLVQIAIAINTDLEKKKYAYGGSTITQQLARTLFLRPR